MQKNLFLIANPCSGTGKVKTQLFPIVQTFNTAGYDVTVHLTSCRGDAAVQAENLSSNYDMVVCCGGDGTLNEVITGLMKNKNKFKLGYIPAGTLNEWSGGLKISRNMKKAAEDIMRDNCIALDIGQFGEHYFSYTASFGAFTEASYSAPQDVKNVLGKLAYFFEGVKSLDAIRPIPLKVVCEDRVIEDKFIFGSVSNSMSVGGVVRYKETVVELGDGLFEVLLIRYPETLADFNNIISGVLSGDLNKKGIEFFHAKTITFENAGKVNWTLDGEYIPPSESVTVNNLHNAINFLVPPHRK